MPEFVEAMVKVKEKIREIRLLDMQRRFMEADEDGSGDLSLEEGYIILAQLNIEARNDAETKIINMCVKEVDMDGSGEVNFQEFIQLVQQAHARISSHRIAEELRIARDNGLQGELLREV